MLKDVKMLKGVIKRIKYYKIKGLNIKNNYKYIK